MSDHGLGLFRWWVVFGKIYPGLGLNVSADFKTISTVTSWINVAGLACTVLLLVTYFALPIQKTSRHYLTVCLVAAVTLMQVRGITQHQDSRVIC